MRTTAWSRRRHRRFRRSLPGWLWAHLRTGEESALLWWQTDYAGRWLEWQTVRVDRFQGDVQHREAEGHGRGGA